MSGELPSALGNCTSLKIIGIKHNNFIGDIPGSIGQLNRLEELQLDNNRMSRVFPSSLSNFTSLKIINLKHNNFTGELSKVNFSRLPNLKLLDLMSNKFTGEILDSIYRCSNLTTLQLSSNKFYGQLSPRIDNLKSLVFAGYIDKSMSSMVRGTASDWRGRNPETGQTIPSTHYIGKKNSSFLPNETGRT
uniref:non-specific serine/threonine protein kinase n=1 Tax=Oryza rufipogon TaxID=4529 RepID=A0A0E0NA40_ORYRU